MARGKKTGGRTKGKRNKSTLEVKELLDKEVDFKVVVGKLFELTKGISVQKLDAKGVPHVYDQPPDPYAAKVLMEYRFGKAPQAIQHSAEINNNAVQTFIIGGKPIKF